VASVAIRKQEDHHPPNVRADLRLADAAEPDDATLAARAAGDPAAFAPLYARYIRPIYRYCYRRLGTHEAAEDATSQTFVKALGAIGQFEDQREGSFRAWIFTIADRVVTDVYRRRRPDADLAAAAEVVDGHLGPEDLAVAHEERRRVQALLAALPEEQRRVVLLRLAGLNGPEIAAVLGRHPAAVKSTQFRAYTRLRRLLGKEEMP
jgi:RNA polymerase sigma factor (sigma-70 family)